MAKKTKTERFKKELAQLINRYSREGFSDTPDWILAEYLYNCLVAYEEAVCDRGLHSDLSGP